MIAAEAAKIGGKAGKDTLSQLTFADDFVGI